ncbi:hypothetical protein SLS62_002566 [Diatrype stigma]|uniref:Rhodopsin domain-containing protein n=1 Tax=Diatrype stigma TaxID=117547 RepID=A0AAN9UU56_9PEZI
MAENPANIPKIVDLMAIGNFFAVLSIAVSKTSFILTLVRLVIEPWQKVALWFMASTINLSMLMIAIVQVFQCPAEPAPGCIDGNIVIRLGVYAACYSAVMDIVLSAFPSLVIWKLQMKRREKTAIIIAMSLGVVAGIVGIYKSSIIPNVARDVDFTFGIALVLIWLAAEFTATVMAASIPFMRPLLRKVSSSVGRQKFSGHSSTHVRLSSRGRNGRQTDTESNRELFATNNKIVRRTEFTLEYNESSSPEEGAEGKHGENHHDAF